MKATEQYFPVVLFTMLHNVFLTLGSVDQILKCTHKMKAIESLCCEGGSNLPLSGYIFIVPWNMILTSGSQD